MTNLWTVTRTGTTITVTAHTGPWTPPPGEEILKVFRTEVGAHLYALEQRALLATFGF